MGDKYFKSLSTSKYNFSFPRKAFELTPVVDKSIQQAYLIRKSQLCHSYIRSLRDNVLNILHTRDDGKYTESYTTPLTDVTIEKY